MTALDAVMSVDEERLKAEKQAEDLNQLMGDMVENPPDEEELDENGEAKTADEIQEEIMEALNLVYERLDALDAATAELVCQTRSTARMTPQGKRWFAGTTTDMR